MLYTSQRYRSDNDTASKRQNVLNGSLMLKSEHRNSVDKNRMQNLQKSNNRNAGNALSCGSIEYNARIDVSKEEGDCHLQPFSLSIIQGLYISNSRIAVSECHTIQLN